jgi:hypothetical protein
MFRLRAKEINEKFGEKIILLLGLKTLQHLMQEWILFA